MLRAFRARIGVAAVLGLIVSVAIGDDCGFRYEAELVFDGPPVLFCGEFPGRRMRVKVTAANVSENVRTLHDIVLIPIDSTGRRVPPEYRHHPDWRDYPYPFRRTVAPGESTSYIVGNLDTGPDHAYSVPGESKLRVRLYHTLADYTDVDMPVVVQSYDSLRVDSALVVDRRDAGRHDRAFVEKVRYEDKCYLLTRTVWGRRHGDKTAAVFLGEVPADSRFLGLATDWCHVKHVIYASGKGRATWLTIDSGPPFITRTVRRLEIRPDSDVIKLLSVTAGEKEGGENTEEKAEGGQE